MVVLQFCNLATAKSALENPALKFMRDTTADVSGPLRWAGFTRIGIGGLR